MSGIVYLMRSLLTRLEKITVGKSGSADANVHIMAVCGSVILSARGNDVYARMNRSLSASSRNSDD